MADLLPRLEEVLGLGALPGGRLIIYQTIVYQTISCNSMIYFVIS